MDNFFLLMHVLVSCVVTVMLLIWLLWFWCVWWLWCHWFGYGNVSKLLLLLLCYMGLSWSLFWEVWEISAQAHLQMVEAIIAGNIRWNRVRSFSPSWDIVQYVISNHWLQNRATKGSKVAGSPLTSAGLGNSSKSRRTTTRAMTTKNSSKLNGNVCPLMDPQPSTSSYLPPVYWVNLNNIVKDTPNWRYFPFL